MGRAYEFNFTLWTAEQIFLLGTRNAAELDWDNLSKVIERLGQQERDQFSDLLTAWLTCLLKWRFHPGDQSAMLDAAIREHRNAVRVASRNETIREDFLGEYMDYAYQCAVEAAEREFGLKGIYPEKCPFRFEMDCPDQKVTPLLRSTPRAASRE